MYEKDLAAKSAKDTKIIFATETAEGHGKDFGIAPPFALHRFSALLEITVYQKLRLDLWKNILKPINCLSKSKLY